MLLMLFILYNERHMNKLTIKIIVGSTRQNRFSEYPARWIFEAVKQRGDFNAELLDLRDYPLPFFAEPVSPAMAKEPYTHEVVARWRNKIKEADGFIVVTPEYNRGYPAVLKNALDYVYYEWNKKPVGFVSYGIVGGARSVEQLRLVSIELQMAPVRAAIHISAPWELRDAEGTIKAGAFEPHQKSAEALFDQLAWWAYALKTAREAN